MTEIGREIEASSKSIYGDKWRQALLTHLTIGVGRIITNRIKSIDPQHKRKAHENERSEEKPEPIIRIEQNPIEYVPSRSCRVAEIIEDGQTAAIAVIQTTLPTEHMTG